MNKSGFSRIKHLASAGVMGISAVGGLGLLVGDVADAGTIGLGFTVTAGGAEWTDIDNSTVSDSSSITSAFGIDDATLIGSFPTTAGSDTLSDAFDGAVGLNVNGTDYNNPDGDVDITGTATGRVVTTDVDVISGLNVHIQYHFFRNRPLVRALFIFENPTAAPINLTAMTGGDLGSDSNTDPQATSNGDTIIDDADLWYITSDRPTGTELPRSDPILTFVRYGIGASVVPTNIQIPGTANDGEYYSYEYSTVVPANSTVRIMAFVDLNTNVTTASSKALDFEDNTSLNAAFLLTGISQTEADEIVNYTALAPLEPPPVIIPTVKAWGLGLLTLLLGLVGIRKRKQLQ